MARPILVAVNDSPEALDAARVAASLARGLDRPVVLAHVVADPPVFPYAELWRREVQRRRAIQRGGDLLEAVAAEIGEANARRRITFSGPAQGAVEERLAALGREEDADLLVVGARSRRALARPLIAYRRVAIVRVSGCAVLVVPPGAARRLAEQRDTPLGSVVCGVDASVSSDRARALAADLAGALGLRLLTISVGKIGPALEAMGELHVSGRDPAAALVQAALRHRAQFIVLGLRGRGILTGPVLRDLAAGAPAPVLVVPPAAPLPRFTSVPAMEPARAAWLSPARRVGTCGIRARRARRAAHG